jgi:DNA-binding HxlR family transcriptional regulator
MPIVERLVGRPQRFSDLKRALADVSQKSLTAALRDLKRDGLVTRIVTPTARLVLIELTQLGHSLLEPALFMARWAIAHRNDLAAARERFASING